MKDMIKTILRESIISEDRIKVEIPLTSDILKMSKIFKKNNFKLFLVGGAVRDFLLKQKIKDFDLATDAVPDKVEEIMTEAGFRTLPTGKAFGVINVFTNQGEYEIATFREDIGSGRRPDAVSFTNIEGDVKRRDLTINALFYDIDTKEIVDLVGGVDDLKQGVVRTVGTPEDRFGEDRLRILRAIRFAGRFGSELDPATDAALQKDSSLEGISGERIRDEFIKGIISDSAYTMKYTYKSRKFEIGTLYINYDTKEAYLEVREIKVDGVYKCILGATNEKIINGVGDFDFIHDQNENKKLTNKDIAKLIIKTRVDDGTINEKLKKEK
jgi:tRNA nucleotidyltransferase/poly(A) polymerase